MFLSIYRCYNTWWARIGIKAASLKAIQEYVQELANDTDSQTSGCCPQKRHADTSRRQRRPSAVRRPSECTSCMQSRRAPHVASSSVHRRRRRSHLSHRDENGLRREIMLPSPLRPCFDAARLIITAAEGESGNPESHWRVFEPRY